ncbi:hypothetical protein VE02_02525 [Pseudogymnoascus sp. 03VT05]|nr:hypothetical protein VE02_02525 [Pseudogymnoascus sp. 03VT05]
MSIFLWATRRVGGLSVLTLASLLSISLYLEWSTRKQSTPKPQGDFKSPSHASHPTAPVTNGGYWTLAFAYYSVLIHVMVLMFSVRACLAVGSLTRGVKAVSRNRSLQRFKYGPTRRLSFMSLASDVTLTSSLASTTASSDAGDSDMIDSVTDVEYDQDKVIHAIIVPNYKEDVDGLRETLDVLASHPQARLSYDVYLAMETRESGAEVKALGLVSEYMKKFRFIYFTMHPSDIPGEAPGKGSNAAWAARKLSERYSIEERRDVIITGIDADSHLSSNYTALITNMHLEYPELAQTTLYSAPILFDRNAHLVPTVVRVADILWCAAGLSGLYACSSIRPPTSVYSLPLELVDRVGGWDSDPEAIGEDLHMYLKCFFALNGNLTSRTVLSPVSQTSVSSGQKGHRGLVMDIRARYAQAMRHMWGALDSGYAMRQMVKLWKNRKTTVHTYRPLHTTLNAETDYLPTPDEKMEERKAENGIFSDVTHGDVSSPDYIRIFYLFHRLFEAHFLPTHMILLVLASSLYTFITADKPDTLHISWTFALTNYLRIISFGGTAVYLMLYESYHATGAGLRLAEMTTVGLAEHMVFSFRKFPGNLVDYGVSPLVAPLFGCVPALQAQFSHFWTQELVYAVSAKPEVVGRVRAKSVSGEEFLSV